MAGIGKVSAIFTASSAGLSAGVSRASTSLKGLKSDVSSLRSGLATLNAIAGTQLFMSIAGSAMSAARSMVSMGQATAENIDNTSKLSARLGLTYGELAGLSYAGDLAGVSMDTIGKAATKADIAFVRASQGSALAQAAFDGIGLSVDDLQNKSPAERFAAITDAIAGLPTEAEKSAASVKLFGKAGAELLPLFAAGAGAVGAATAEANAFGLALTGAQGKDVEAMNDAFTRASGAISGIVTQVTAYLAPSIQGIADTFTALVGDIGGATIGQRIGDGILDGAEFLAGIGDYLISNFGSVFEYLSGVGEQWGGVFNLASKIGNVMTIAGNGVAMTIRAVVLLFSNLVEQAISVVSMIPGVGSALEGVAATVKGFNEELNAGALQNFEAMKGGLSDLMGESGDKTGAAIAGPLTKAFQEFRATSRDSAAAIDVAKKQTIGDLVQPAGEASAALTAVDSRSKEGVAEMFRLMRGAGEDIQARQLAAQERMADGIEELGGNELELVSMGSG